SLKLQRSKGQSMTLFVTNDTSDSGWRSKAINLRSSSPFRLTFEADFSQHTSDTGIRIDEDYVVALDDFILEDGTCNTTDFCDFETDTCDWKSSNWQRVDSKDVADVSTGSENGHYLQTTIS